MMLSIRNDAGSEREKKMTMRDNAFFINSAAFTLFLTACAIYEEINRVLAEKTSVLERKMEEEESEEKEKSDIDELKNDVESALCACNKPTNIFCILSLLSSVREGEAVTIDTLRKIAKSTSSELSTPVCRILDRIERKPELVPITISLVKERLSALPTTHWRKHAFMKPLENCEQCVISEETRVANSNR